MPPPTVAVRIDYTTHHKSCPFILRSRNTVTFAQLIMKSLCCLYYRLTRPVRRRAVVSPVWWHPTVVTAMRRSPVMTTLESWTRADWRTGTSWPVCCVRDSSRPRRSLSSTSRCLTSTRYHKIKLCFNMFDRLGVNFDILHTQGIPKLLIWPHMMKSSLVARWCLVVLFIMR